MTDHTDKTFMPRTHYVLDAGTVADMLTELATAKRCQDCNEEPAVCVEGSEEWELVATHDPTCPSLVEPKRQKAGD